MSHYNIRPVIDIFVSVEGRDLGSVARRVNELVDQARGTLPRGSQIAVRGQVETMRTSFFGLGVGVAMAIVLVYLLIVVNFQSWVDPLIIVSALPAALAGIIWMLFLTGTHLSVPALTGAIMTMGVATANSILMVSFARQRLAAGAPPLTAALEAGASRIRPVLMTAFAMIIGMIPMALGLGEGAEQNAPLAARSSAACCSPPYRRSSSCRSYLPAFTRGSHAAHGATTKRSITINIEPHHARSRT